MSIADPVVIAVETLADLLRELGDVPPDRVLMRPPPGTADEADLLLLVERDKCLCELIDGVLVEKPMGWYESRLAVALTIYLEAYLTDRDIGFVLGENAPHRLRPRLVRLPDVSFVRYESLPPPDARRTRVAEWVPDLAVEVLSESNRPREMERKLQEYFMVGVKLVWYADPESRNVRVFHSPDDCRILSDADELSGEDLLPGFRLSIRDWFARADRSMQGSPA